MTIKEGDGTGRTIGGFEFEKTFEKTQPITNWKITVPRRTSQLSVKRSICRKSVGEAGNPSFYLEFTRIGNVFRKNINVSLIKIATI